MSVFKETKFDLSYAYPHISADDPVPSEHRFADDCESISRLLFCLISSSSFVVSFDVPHVNQ